MGQSLIKNYIHIVFSTKYRQRLIYPPVEKQLHAYLGSICNLLECHVIAVGGYTDHVHILCKLSQKIPLMKLAGDIKAKSSKWIKTKGPAYQSFSWQDGYAAFSVQPSDVDIIQEYINNQHQHHRTKGYKEEVLAFLKKYDIDFDERYIWE